MEGFLNQVRTLVAGGLKTPQPELKGEREFIQDMQRKTGRTKDEARALYHQAVSSSDWSGKYYERPENPIMSAIHELLGGKASKANEQQAVMGAATGSPTPTQQPSPTPIPVPTLAPNADDFEQKALPILNQYEIPPSVGFGMRDAEGGKIGANNVYNIGAGDADPSKAENYASIEDAVREYAKLLSTSPRYHQAYADRKDKDKMLKEIVKAGYAGDPETWKQRSAKAGGAGKIYDTYDEFVRATNGYKRYKN
jgi:hypothetical protein